MSDDRNAMEAIERPKSLTAVATERLREAIIDGTIKLGALLSEKQMAELLGTSKTPVREAFAHLQALGLIEVLPQRGGMVFRPTLDQVRELCEVRLELEVAALRHSIERDRTAFADRLSVIVAKMATTYDVAHPLGYQRLDNEFHYSFFTHCGNSLLGKAYDLFSPRICALRTHLSTPQPQLLERSLEEHKAILKLAKKGDVQRAVHVLKEHIDRTREYHSEFLSMVKTGSGRL
jgi:DNA-binding GntR family transcriptional regulator